MVGKRLNNNNNTIKELLKKFKISKDYTLVNKKMISRGVFIGLFIAFIPMPMQMLAVIAFAPVGKFNIPVAIAMCWLSNPVTMPFIYYMEYLTGSFILGMDVISVQLTLEWFNQNLKNIMIQLYFGAFVYSLISSLLAYYIINTYWKSYPYKNKNLKRKTS
ncbi:DUF2062 domain-containing protein [Arcobacteraceae bacterium]|nr:DUF2062 domain-containing protein [Arcobacteraceae bacterium]